MPETNRRQRELARAKAMRQAERRRAQQRRRRLITASVAGALVVILVVGAVVLLLVGGKDDNKSTVTAATPTPSAAPTTAAPVTVACGGTTPAKPKTMTFAKAPALTIDTKATYTMTLSTSCGPIKVDLFADKAPQTTNAMAFLAGKGYFDGTFCHRETGAAAGFTVLQCGDQTGTGSGGPGFTLPEENLKGTKYLRGYLAMAKTSAAHSTGSQFFLLDSDAPGLSSPSATYTLLGKMDAAGLAVLDKIVKIGEDDSNGTGDGAPKQRVYLDKVTVTKS